MHAAADRAVGEDGDDVLGFGKDAGALADLLADPGLQTPAVIAVSGKWGTGKSSFARLLGRRLRDRGAGNVLCWFNAWLYLQEGAAPLLYAVAQACDRSRPWWRRMLAPLPSFLVRPGRRWLRLVLRPMGILAGVLLVGAFLYVLAPPALRPWVTPVDPASLGLQPEGSLVAILAALGLGLVPPWVAAAKGIGGAKGWGRRPSQDDLRQGLGALLRDATPPGGRFVVFVEDLDRCTPSGAWAVLRSIEETLGGTAAEGLVVVLVADMDALSAQLESQGLATMAQRHLPAPSQQRVTVYENEAERPGALLGRILRLRFDLPAPDDAAMRRLLASWRDPREPGTA